MTDTNASGIPVEVEMKHPCLYRKPSASSAENPESPAPRCDGQQDGNTHHGESRVNQRVGLNPLQHCLLARYKSLWSLAEGFTHGILCCLMSLSVNMHGGRKPPNPAWSLDPET